MRNAWHDIWGCARGAARGLTPQARILIGTGVFAACLIVPAATWPGAALAVGFALSWLAFCRPPLRVVRIALGFGLSLLLSSLLIIYLLALVSGSPAASPAVCLGLLASGASAFLVTLTTVTVLSMSELREGLFHLPVPAMVSGILLQMVHQTATLAYETRRMAGAMAVRGATSNRRSGLTILMSLPRVWLPRVIERADRVAAAMELRGYCDGETGRRAGLALTRIDKLGLVLSAGAVVLAIVVRCWSLR